MTSLLGVHVSGDVFRNDTLKRCPSADACQLNACLSDPSRCIFLAQQQGTKHPGVENGPSELADKEEALKAMQHSISTHRDLLRQVTSYPNRKLKQPDFLPYDPADSLADPTAFPLPESHYTFPSSFPTCRSEKRLKPLQELCNPYFLSLMKEQLANTERRLRGDKSILRTTRVASLLSRRHPLVNFLFELWGPEDGHEEVGEGTEAELQTETRRGLELFQSDPMSLESFCSCVQELPIKMEAEDAETATSDPSVELAGSVSSTDSIEVLGTEKSYRAQHLATSAESRGTKLLYYCSVAPDTTGCLFMEKKTLDMTASSILTEAATGMTDTRRVAVDANIRRVRAYARRANSEDSIEVLSTTESIFPDDLTAITEEDAEQQPQNNGLGTEEESPEAECQSEETTLNVTTSAGDQPVQQEVSRLHKNKIPVNGGVPNEEKQVVDGDKPAAMSKLLQGNATVPVFTSKYTQVSVNTRLSYFTRYKVTLQGEVKNAFCCQK